MQWSRIAFAEGFESANCRWVRTVFQHLYEHVSEDDEFDAIALYRGHDQTEGALLFFSPRATTRLRAAMSRFHLTECERPNADEVELIIGVPMASRPGWCELTHDERLEWAELSYSAGLEVVAPDEGEDEKPHEVAS